MKIAKSVSLALLTAGIAFKDRGATHMLVSTSFTSTGALHGLVKTLLA